MLILCLFPLHKTKQKSKENLTLHHKGKCFIWQLTYWDKILNLEDYIFEKFFTTLTFWDGLPVFVQ